MPDRTKLPRPTGNKAMPTNREGFGGDFLRSAFDQNTQINTGFGQPLLDTYAVQSVENQQAGPSATFEEYEPDPTSQVHRSGLDSSGGPAKSPKSKNPRVP